MTEYKRRKGLFAAVVAGVFSLGFVAIGLTDPDTDDPQSVGDHAAVLLFSLALIATGAALASARMALTNRTAAWALTFAATGALAAGVGNFLEDSVRVDAFGVLFALGGLVLVLGLLIAGVTAFARDRSVRWFGLAFVLIAAGVIIGEEPGFTLVGVIWVALAALLERETRAAPLSRRR